MNNLILNLAEAIQKDVTVKLGEDIDIGGLADYHINYRACWINGILINVFYLIVINL